MPPHAQCVARLLSVLTTGVVSDAIQRPPDDQDALIQLACSVAQRVLALELQADNSMMGYQLLLTTLAAELRHPHAASAAAMHSGVSCS